MKSPANRLLILAISTMVIVGACGSTASPAASGGASSPGTSAVPGSVEPTTQVEEVVLATGVSEFGLTPMDWSTGYPGLELVRLQYDTLAIFAADNEPHPLLATEWSSNADATEWTLTLRDDVTWHDGEKLTADDVAFTIDYQNNVVRSGIQFTTLKGFTARVVDDTHVVITSPQPQPDIMRKLTIPVILPKHIWDGVGAVENLEESKKAIVALADHTGTGPYMMGDYDPEVSYTLLANEDYFLGAPAVKRIVVPIIKDATARAAALRSGEIDAMTSDVPPENLADFSSVENLKLLEGDLFTSVFLVPNVAKKPWDDRVLRKAISMTIDPQELIDIVRLGEGVVGNQGFIHPSLPGAADGLTIARDYSAANKLLDDAGYLDTDGDGIRETPDGEVMSYEILCESERADRVRAADLIAEWAANIGISLKTAPRDANTAYSMVFPVFAGVSDDPLGQYDLVVWGWSAVGQNVPAQGLQLFYHSDPTKGLYNTDFYKSATMDGLLDELGRSNDPQQRLDLMTQVQNLASEDQPFIVLWYPKATFAVDTSVYDGWRFQPGIGVVNKLSFLPQVYP